MLPALLFDVDGTLVDSNDLHVDAWFEALLAEGHSTERTVIRAQVGKGADQLVPTLIPGADESLIKRLGDRHAAAFRPRLEFVKPFAKAGATVRLLKERGHAVVLASSASEDEVDHYLDLLELGGTVDAVTTADDVEHSKPAPDIFRRALEKIAASSDAAFVIGDTPYDVAAAQGAGVKAIGVRTGGFDDETLSGAVAILDGVQALPDWLERQR